MWVKGKTDVAIKHHLEYNHVYIHVVLVASYMLSSTGPLIHLPYSLYVPLLGEPHME